MITNVVTVEPRGTQDHPRFLLKKDGLYWDGKGWNQESDASVYHDQEQASQDAQFLQRGVFKESRALAIYTAPVKIVIRSKTPVGRQEAIEWLKKAISLQLNVGDNGVGPVSDSVAEIVIDWNGLRNAAEG
jgi:hypothetical protein